MTPRQRLALAIASAVLALGWLACTVLGGILAFWSPIPAGFTRLFLPATVSFNITATSAADVLALVLAATACAVVFALLWSLLSRPRPLNFAAGWLAAVLAACVTVLLWAIGDAIAGWPPPRIAWLFGGVQQSLVGAGMVGILWGWIPALVGTRMGRHTRAAAGLAPDQTARNDHGDRPATAAPQDAAARTPARGRWVLAAGAVAASALLVGVVPLAASQTAAAPAPTPSETQPTVVYGSPTVGPTQQGADPNWCTSNQVTATTGTGDAATGHRMLRVGLTNVSPEECTLNGYPDLAFDDEAGSAMGIFVVSGGSFMTTDAGPQPITLAPGSSAHADIGWNAQAAAGDLHAATVLVASYSGQERTSLSADLDIVAGGTVSVTAWELTPE